MELREAPTGPAAHRAGSGRDGCGTCTRRGGGLRVGRRDARSRPVARRRRGASASGSPAGIGRRARTWSARPLRSPPRTDGPVFAARTLAFLQVAPSSPISAARRRPSRTDSSKVDHAASPTDTVTRFPSRPRARSIVAALVAWSGLSMRRTSLSATPRSRARPRCDMPASRNAS